MGFLEEPEQVVKIKAAMDWLSLEGISLHVDTLADGTVSEFSHMQSRCLLITGMSESFVDVSKLRELYAVIRSPVYCQVLTYYFHNTHTFNQICIVIGCF